MKKIETFLKNILLGLLLLLSRKGKDRGDNLNSNSKVLMIRLNRIGDALVVTPLISIIKANVGCEIHILASRHNNFIFQNNPDVYRTITFEKGISGFFRIFNLIKKEKYSAVFDLHDDVSTTVSFILALSGIGNRIGLSKGNDKVYTKTVTKKDPAKTHVIERIIELASVFNIEPDMNNLNVKYIPGEQSLQKIDGLLCRIFERKSFLLGLNISAGSHARFWSADNYIKLVRFLSTYDFNLLILCSLKDLKYAAPLTKNNNIFYSESFDEFAAMISKLDFLFTPDTAAVHLASAFKVPVFGMYVKYNTDDMIWYPYKSDFEYILTKEPNLKQIRFDHVISKLKPFLEKHLYERNSTL